MSLRSLLDRIERLERGFGRSANVKMVLVTDMTDDGPISAVAPREGLELFADDGEELEAFVDRAVEEAELRDARLLLIFVPPPAAPDAADNLIPITEG
jgi:hypothetical protein